MGAKAKNRDSLAAAGILQIRIRTGLGHRDALRTGATHTLTSTHSLPSLRYSTMNPLRPEFPIFSGVSHLTLTLVSVTSSTETSTGAEGAPTGRKTRKINKDQNNTQVIQFMVVVFFFFIFSSDFCPSKHRHLDKN